ncbi:hypothetical protein [Streptomyces sp. NBC_00233]|uniref:hypothetical protein n=1 Tax=Streptomyces sp. NBC_00233 TaxID=2975686 RepID=UPI00225659AE|nr:hypothetical protein [Streptomyces sp. NBC_00233]MCX5232960.1 hypothetical protein [Streptomyces sp. NBC_00233]
MSDSTQQPAAEPAVTFLRRHGAVITLALLFLGYPCTGAPPCARPLASSPPWPRPASR